MEFAVCVGLGEDLMYATYSDGITVGKKYRVISSSEEMSLGNIRYRLIVIENDKGKAIRYSSQLFLPLEEWRAKRISAIGI